MLVLIDKWSREETLLHLTWPNIGYSAGGRLLWLLIALVHAWAEDRSLLRGLTDGSDIRCIHRHGQRSIGDRRRECRVQF